MSTIRPTSRPRLTRSEAEGLLRSRSVRDDVVLLAVRGYYANTLGKPGVNDRGLYDDAIIFLSPTAYVTFNANCDPSRYRRGYGTGTHKGMARLKAGIWRYRPGLHRMRYMALRQAAPVTVIRDGRPDYEETGWFGINIHRRGWGSTSSLGCQTIPPDQWKSFITLVRSELKRYGKGELRYVLVEGI